MSIRSAIHVIALLALAAPVQAQAPPVCAPREQVLAAITGEKYGEQPMVELEGMQTGGVMQLYGNPVTGTWTVVGYPNPVTACILATGKKMRMLHPSTMGKPT